MTYKMDALFDMLYEGYAPTKKVANLSEENIFLNESNQDLPIEWTHTNR